MIRTVVTYHSRYVLDYDAMTFTRERTHADASHLRTEGRVYPFSRAYVVNGRLHVEDDGSGYWCCSTLIDSDVIE